MGLRCSEFNFTKAYWESAQDAEEKERIKREERVIKRWTRLVQGLRIRQRLQEQYADKPSSTQAQHGADNREVNQVSNPLVIAEISK